MNKLISIFLKQEDLHKLPISLQKQLPAIVVGNTILFLYFIAGAVVRYRSDAQHSLLFLIAVSMSSFSFISSLLFLRKGNYQLGAYLTSLGLWLNSTWVGVFLPPEGIVSIYRMITYIFAATIVNIIMCVTEKQMLVYMAGNTVSFLLVSVFYIIPNSGGFTKELLGSFLLLLLTLIPINIFLRFFEQFNKSIILITNKSAEDSKRQVERLQTLLEKTRKTFELGQNLAQKAEQSQTLSRTVKESLESTQREIQHLETKTNSNLTANADIVEHISGLQSATSEHNAFLQETSSAITEIGTTIQSISGRAQQKHTQMTAILQKSLPRARNCLSFLKVLIM